MSLSVTGALPNATGTTYDFRNATNAQFLQEVQSLRQQGALSADQSVLAVLDASGGDSVPINGQPLSATQALSDSTTHDFISIFQTQLDWMQSTSGSVGTSNVNSILQALEAYQGKSAGSSPNNVSSTA